jgi:hypothetical protein
LDLGIIIHELCTALVSEHCRLIELSIKQNGLSDEGLGVL